MSWRQKALYFLFLFFDGALIVVEWGVVGWGRKYYLGPAEIASFSSRDFSQSNKHDTFWHAASSGYFCVLWLWAIAAMDFHSLEIYKKLGLYLSTIIIAGNNHADNHFYKYICFKYYTVWNQFFLLKCTLKVFNIHKNHSLQKKNFIEKKRFFLL